MKKVLNEWRKYLKEAEKAWKGAPELDPEMATAGESPFRAAQKERGVANDMAAANKATNVKKRQLVWLFAFTPHSDPDYQREEQPFIYKAIEEYFKDSSDPGPWDSSNKVEAIANFLSWLNEKYSCSVTPAILAHERDPDPCARAMAMLKRRAKEGPDAPPMTGGSSAAKDLSDIMSWYPSALSNEMSDFRSEYGPPPPYRGGPESFIEEYVEKNQCRDKPTKRTPCHRAISYIKYFKKGLKPKYLKAFEKELFQKGRRGKEAEKEFFGDPLVRESRKLTNQRLERLNKKLLKGLKQ